VDRQSAHRAMAGELRELTAADLATMTDTIGHRPSDELSHRFGGAAKQERWS
jgi:hypothetical protein